MSIDVEWNPVDSQDGVENLESTDPSSAHPQSSGDILGGEGDGLLPDPGTEEGEGQEGSQAQEAPDMVCRACGRELKVLERNEDEASTYLSMGCMAKGCEMSMKEEWRYRLVSTPKILPYTGLIMPQ